MEPVKTDLLGTERPYLYIKPPETEEAGRYLLIAARPAFGTSLGSPVMVKVDSLKHFGVGESAWIEGWVNGTEERVIEFPAMCPYLLIPMKMVSFLSTEEAAARDKELAKKIKGLMKEEQDLLVTLEEDKVPGVYL